MSLLTGSANCVKNVLFVFNLAFMITGIALIAVGVGVTVAFSQYEDFLVSKFFSVPTFLIVIGSLVIVITFFGCWGAIKENYCLILSFSVMLGIIFILELAAGISGYVLRADAEGLIETTLMDSLTEYKRNSSSSITTMWDTIQREFSCCGVNSDKDWNTQFPNELPLSCCNIEDGMVGVFYCNSTDEMTYRHSAGCLTTFSNVIKAHAVSLGAAGIVIAVLQFFGVIFACYIAREIKIRNGITGFM